MISPMETASNQHPVSASEAAALTPAQWSKMLSDKDEEIVQLLRQLAWFQRQIFGQKSERRLPLPQATQGSLGQDFSALPEGSMPGRKRLVAAHEREAKAKRPQDGGDGTAPFFDEAKVPVEVIAVANPEIAGLDPQDYQIIGEKVSYRLAQRPGAYVVLKYVRPVVKRLDTALVSCPPAPVGVLEGSRADVSLLSGTHRRLQDAGFKVSRSWLTHLMQQAVALLEPIYNAQLDSIRASRVVTMDETPIKAGPTGTGKMKAAYFWPIYGERDEICFAYQPGRSGADMKRSLGIDLPKGAVLLTDGYEVYARYARRIGLTHAQCWAHARRYFFEAQDVEPDRAAGALEMMGALYKIEEAIREKELSGEAKCQHRHDPCQTES